MAYSWAQLAFVEKWRLQSVRGAVIGMHRPADRTYFDLRLKLGEGNAAGISGTVDLHLQDAGDIIREKRLPLLHQASVVVRIVGSATVASQEGPRPRRPLESGSTVTGTLLSLEEDEALADVGFPVVVQLTEPAANLATGLPVAIVISETPKGFLVI